MASSPLDQTTPECREALAELFAYLDGEVPAEDRDQVAAHLDRCSDCLEAFEFHHELRQVVAERCRTDAPIELRSRILDAIARLDDRGTD